MADPVNLVDIGPAAVPALDVFSTNQRFKVEAALRDQERRSAEKQAAERNKIELQTAEKELKARENIAAQEAATRLRVQELQNLGFEKLNKAKAALQESSQTFQREQTETQQKIDQANADRTNELQQKTFDLNFALATGRVEQLKENQAKAEEVEKEIAKTRMEMAAAETLRLRTTGELESTFGELEEMLAAKQVADVQARNAGATLVQDAMRDAMRVDVTRAPGFWQRLVNTITVPPGFPAVGREGLAEPIGRRIGAALTGAKPSLARPGLTTSSSGEGLLKFVIAEVTPDLNKIDDLQNPSAYGSKLQSVVSGFAAVRRLSEAGEPQVAREKMKELDARIAEFSPVERQVLAGIAVGLEETTSALEEGFATVAAGGGIASTPEGLPLRDLMRGLTKSNKLAMRETLKNANELSSLLLKSAKTGLKRHGVRFDEDPDEFNGTMELIVATAVDLQGLRSRGDIKDWLRSEGFEGSRIDQLADRILELQKARDDATKRGPELQLELERQTLERNRTLLSPGDILSNVEPLAADLSSAIGGG